MYDQINELQDRVIEKTKKGYKGSFGTHLPRFRYRDEELMDLPGPGAYDDARLQNKLNKEKDILGTQFRDEQKRVVFKPRKDKVPGVGLYDLKHGTIEEVVNQQ